MDVALRVPRMTQEQFLDWAEAQDIRHEFDGFQPVAMVGSTLNHNVMSLNIQVALRSRLKGGPCRPFGIDIDLATVGDVIRFPDALVTCAQFAGTDRLVPGVVVVFEVLSPTSGRNDRIVKLREYRAVDSIRRYVILEYASAALTVFARPDAGMDWTASALTADDTLRLPEIGIEIPVAELYEDVELPADPSLP